MTQTPQWNQVRGPKTSADGIFKAGELFNKATKGISGMLQDHSNKLKSDASSMFDAHLEGITDAAGVDQMQQDFMARKIPGQEHLMPDAALASFNRKRKSIEAADMAKLQKINTEMQIADRTTTLKQGRKDKADAKLLRNEFPKFKGPNGEVDVAVAEAFALSKGISPKVFNAELQQRTIKDQYKAAQRALTAPARRDKAIEAGYVTKNGVREINHAKLIQGFKANGFANPEIEADKYLKMKHDTENAPQKWAEADFDNKTEEALKNINLITNAGEALTANHILNQVKQVMTAPGESPLKKFIIKQGGEDWIVRIFNEATERSNGILGDWGINQFNEGGQMGRLIGELKKHRAKGSHNPDGFKGSPSTIALQGFGGRGMTSR